MVAYSDFQLKDLKNLSIKSFVEILINDFYPFIYSELNKLEEEIHNLKSDYDVDTLEFKHSRIFNEFDEMFRKEKLVLFPFILKLEEENRKSENCTPFKNTKSHYTAIVHHLFDALKELDNYFVTDNNAITIEQMRIQLVNLKDNMIELQLIKDKHFYKNYKNCGNCGSINGE